MTGSEQDQKQRNPIRIMLVEDHHIVRNGISVLLEAQADMIVVSEAANGLQAMEILDRGLNVDVVITDIDMQYMDGIELIAKVNQIANAPKTIVLSMMDAEKNMINAFKAGTDAYLLKKVATQELVFAVRHVMAEGKYACAEITMRLVNRLVDATQNSSIAEFDLSERDLEVIELLAGGYTNQEIADKLFTSKRTVEGYRLKLMNKTGSRNTAALVRFAMHYGLLK